MPNPDSSKPTEFISGPTFWRRRPGRRIAWWQRLLLLGLLAGSTVQAEIPKEYQVKAAFLYNFTKFVEWSPQHFASGERPIVIGVLGRNPFGDELEKIVRGRNVNGRAITVKVITSILEARSTDLVFVCAGEERQLDGKWRQLQDAGVLTVGESKVFSDHGGTITFLLEGDKVRFAINLAAGESAGLKISAQLLKLATTVHRNP